MSIASLVWLIPLAVTLSSTFAINYYEARELTPCPHVSPVSDVTLQQIEGKWHLSVVVLDATQEDVRENSICVNGQVAVHNSTHMKQIWNMYTPHLPGMPAGTFELAVDVVRPGMWSVETPLGNRMDAVLFGYDTDFAMAVFCGWQKGEQVHVFTAAVTREGLLTESLRLKMSSIMLKNGYKPETSKLILWNKC